MKVVGKSKTYGRATLSMISLIGNNHRIPHYPSVQFACGLGRTEELTDLNGIGQKKNKELILLLT